MTEGNNASATSDAALCRVKVSPSVLETDCVLDLVLQWMQKYTHQVTVTATPADQAKPLELTVGGGGGGFVLTQRNAILRSLVGPALHGAMDHDVYGAGTHLWAGGQWALRSSRHSSSHVASIQAAQLIHWMSVADSLRNGDPSAASGRVEDVTNELEVVLEQSAFVVSHSAAATLGDLDLCVALWSAAAKTTPIEYPKALLRWMVQCAAVLEQLSLDVGTSSLAEQKFQIPAAVAQELLRVNTAQCQPPMQFNGTEDASAILAALYKPTAAKGSAVGKTVVATEKEKFAATTTIVENPNPSEGKKTKLTKQEKSAVAKAQGKKPAPPVAAETATFDIMALDIRVGKIIKVWPHETADKLYCEEIDLGNGEIRQIASGLRPFYEVQDLQDRVVLVLCNLKKRTLVGFPSHGMVLCASNADHTQVEFVIPSSTDSSSLVLGERVVFGGLDASAPPEPEAKVAKKKIFEGLAPDLKTDETGQVVWKGHAAKTSAGPIMALNKMANASVS